MSNAPDWLINLSNNSPGLVDDSPQFRALEAQTQKNNLTQAANSALHQTQQRANQATVQSIQAGQKAIQDITPIPNPLAGPTKPFLPAEKPRNVPGPEDFNADPPPYIPPAPQEAAPAPMESVPMEDSSDPLSGQEDIQSIIQTISQTTGLPMQQVATMALLGKEIDRIEKENPQALSAPPTAGLPQPLTGPPSVAPSPPPAAPPAPSSLEQPAATM